MEVKLNIYYQPNRSNQFESLLLKLKRRNTSSQILQLGHSILLIENN